MRILKLNSANFMEVAKQVSIVVADGGLVVYPTDTVYGLGVDPTNEAAVEKLWKFKGERGDKPVLLVVSDEMMAKKYVKLNDLGKKIIRKYWPGSVSVVGVSKNRVVKKLHGGKGTLGLRMPNNKFVLNLVGIFGKPITSTSANISGGRTCGSLEEFSAVIPKESMDFVDVFVDGGTIEDKLPSTIVDISSGEMRMVREGEVVVEI